jgi:uncharacterized repeat protein (TIGR01451 family)
VTLTETVPAYTIFSAGASTPGWVCVPDGSAGSTCTFAVGDVASGGAIDFAVVVINPIPAGVTEITNTAEIGDDDDNPGDEIASDSTPLDAAPDLQIDKDDGGATVEAGDTILYTLTYTNAGYQEATGVVITETVPANTAFNAVASTAGWVCVPDGNVGSTCTFAIGALMGYGDGGAVIFAVDVNSPIPDGVTYIDNTSEIGDDGHNGPDRDPTDNTAATSTPTLGAADLSLTKTDSEDPVIAGVTLVYSLTVTNHGPATASSVTVTDELPGEVVFGSASTSQGICTEAGGLVTCALGTLSDGDSASLAITVTVQTDAVGTITNTANVTSATPDLDLTDNDVTETTAIVENQCVYFDDFETTAGLEWSNQLISATPNGRRFLGEFGNEIVSLTLEDLPAHTRATVAFDLYVIRSWDGNTITTTIPSVAGVSSLSPQGIIVIGPDVWQMGQAGSEPLLRTTFSNWDDQRQAYPGGAGTGDYPAMTGATEVDSLGYVYLNSPLDSVYRLTSTFGHTDRDLVLDFSAMGLQNIEDESWGLDNVQVCVDAAAGGGKEYKVYLPFAAR